MAWRSLHLRTSVPTSAGCRAAFQLPERAPSHRQRATRRGCRPANCHPAALNLRSDTDNTFQSARGESWPRKTQVVRLTIPVCWLAGFPARSRRSFLRSATSRRGMRSRELHFASGLDSFPGCWELQAICRFSTSSAPLSSGIQNRKQNKQFRVSSGGRGVCQFEGRSTVDWCGSPQSWSTQS